MGAGSRAEVQSWGLFKRTELALTLGLTIGAHCALAQQAGNAYATYGVHNSPTSSPCANADCVYVREPGQPADPRYPDYWSSDWKMYRVFHGYVENPPPYDGSPPPALKAGRDYEISKGTTYYDSTWRGPPGEGAMMEHYKGRCLPIFPISNHFTCSFISLGDTAFFITYDKDRPNGMPPACLFSSLNHPPRPDFISHLPYSSGDSGRLANRVRAYSFWIDGGSGQPIQIGVSPDRTKDQAIMFGYAFFTWPTRDRVDKSATPYLHPQSFYFTGFPLAPANAPIVSQNYTNFTMTRPDPKKTWDLVSRLDPKTVPPCQLFNPPDGTVQGANAGGAPSWSNIKMR
jgi:hypothetical protein